MLLDSSWACAVHVGKDGDPPANGATIPDAPATPPPSLSLNARWTFEEGSGTTTVDSSGWGNTGALINGPTWTTLTPPTDLGGRYALRFDGLDDFVYVPDRSILRTPSLTVAAWIKADIWEASSWEGVVVGKDDWQQGGTHGYALRTGGDGRLGFVVGVGGQWREALTLPIMKVGRWYHVAGTYTSGWVRVFIDGVERAAMTTGGPIAASFQPLNIGRDPYAITRAFSGTIDDVRLYETELSVEQLQILAHRRLYRIYLPRGVLFWVSDAK
jgi:hypothetical protein